MKIGLLTVHCSVNPGASLQAYALCRALEKNGHNVEIINYRPYYFTDAADINAKRYRKSIMEIIKYLLTKGRLDRVHNKYAEFEKKFLPNETERYNDFNQLINSNLKYDVFMCGSDQIWNPSHVKHDPSMHLGFVKSSDSKKYSYAASIGKDKLDKKDIEFLKNCTLSIDNISVREESAKETLLKIDKQKQIQRHIDPTMLLSIEEWESIESYAYRKIKGPYAIFYPMVDNEITDDLLREFKNKMNIQIVALTGKIKKLKYVDKQIRVFSPEDFVGYIHHSEYVITNSFHGNVFAMMFSKKLIPYNNPSSNSRLLDLYKLFHVDAKQVFTIEDFRNTMIEEWKPVSIPADILDKEREKSQRFLSFS